MTPQESNIVAAEDVKTDAKRTTQSQGTGDLELPRYVSESKMGGCCEIVLKQAKKFDVLAELDVHTEWSEERQKNVLVQRQRSTVFTLCGTMVSFVFLLIFVIQIIDNYATSAPQIIEVAVEAADAEYELPDTAITFSMANGANAMTEGELLSYLSIEFKWITITTGMSNRTNLDTRELGVSFGKDCELSAGYVPQSSSGSLVWPVFCVMNSKLPQAKRQRIRGRFGDDIWKYLQIKVGRCDPSRLTVDMSNAFTKATGGICKTSAEIDMKVAGLGANIWFKFNTVDWKKSRQAIPAEGQIPGRWSWYYFGILSNDAVQNTMLDLLYNKAQLNNPTSSSQFLGAFGTKDVDVVEWFRFDHFEPSASGTSSQDFKEGNVLICNVRIAQMMRNIIVRYTTVMEVLSEISGSWTICALMGYFFYAGTAKLNSRLKNA